MVSLHYTKIIPGIFLEVNTFTVLNIKDIFIYLIIIYKLTRLANRIYSFRNYVKYFLNKWGNYFHVLFFPIIKITGYFKEFRS